jgi:hypothetical protein
MDFKGPGLNYWWSEKNAWYEAAKSYRKCYERYFYDFNKLSDWEDELKRYDVNTICQKELQALISASNSIDYKQTVGIMPQLWDFRNFE